MENPDASEKTLLLFDIDALRTSAKVDKINDERHAEC